MVAKGNSDNFETYFTAKWVIQFPATAQYINANVNIDAQVKTASFGQSVNVRWGRTNSYVGTASWMVTLASCFPLFSPCAPAHAAP